MEITFLIEQLPFEEDEASGHSPGCSRMSLDLMTSTGRGFATDSDVLVVCSPDCPLAEEDGHGE